MSWPKDGGQHKLAAYQNTNPQGLVPALEVDGQAIGQSLAILEYLDGWASAKAVSALQDSTTRIRRG